MINKGQFRVRKQTQKDYNSAFKLQVVEEVERAELTQDAAHSKYSIQGNVIILVTLKKYERFA